MTTINGLPAHPLLVHAVVVLIPLTAVLLVLVAVWPPARHRLALLTAVLAAASLVLVPITVNAGVWLIHHVAPTPLVAAHARLADTMLPWAIALFSVAVVVAARELWESRPWSSRRLPADRPGAAQAPMLSRRSLDRHGRLITIVLAVLAVLVAAGSISTVYRIGDSGSRAAWTGHFNQQANPLRTHANAG